MNADQIRAVVVRLLGRIAPDADIEHLNPDADLREEVGLDSMDVVNFMVALHKELGIDVPERDYAKMATLNKCASYLSGRSAGQARKGNSSP